MRTPKRLLSIAAGAAAIATTGCTPDISDEVEEIICNTSSVAGQFTRSGYVNLTTGNHGGDNRAKAVNYAVKVQDVKKLSVGYSEHRGGVLSGHLCEVKNRLPQVLASFDPTNKDTVLSLDGNLYFTAREDISHLTATHQVPKQLQRNDGEDWNHLWIIDPKIHNDNPDSQYAYEVSVENKVHGGFVGTVKDLSKGGFGNRLHVSSYATLYEQGNAEPMTLNEFLKEVR